MTSDLGTISGRLLDPTDIISTGDVITTDGYLAFCRSTSNFVYVKRDFLFRSGIWREDYWSAAIKTKHKRKKKLSVVIGHSDINTTKVQSLILRLFGFRKVFGTNLTPLKDKAFSLPLGLTNDTTESNIHPVLGNHNDLVCAHKISNHSRVFKPSIYVNFTAKNNEIERGRLLELVSRSPSPYAVLHEEPDFTSGGRQQYLKRCREFALTPCPEGNGVDTHRFWETVYMGGTPVVTKNIAMADLYSRVPCIVVDDWEELLDVKEMKTRWEALFNFEWQPDVLRLSYWTSLMAASTSRDSSTFDAISSN